jgi:hypothetical protein
MRLHCHNESFGFRDAALIYAIFFVLLAFPYWFSGNIIAPYNQKDEIAATTFDHVNALENKKFSDYPREFVPEVAMHLTGPRSTWIALWTNLNELGRPVNQLWGFSPAYPPSWLLTWFVSSPQRFLTILSLGTCFIGGLFVLLFCKEMRLTPLGSLVVSCSFASAPVFMYWLTFPMFVASWCWSAGALYGAIRLARKPDLLGWAILSFSIYSLLMTAYQQMIVYHAYLLAGYGVFLCLRILRFDGIAATNRFFMSSGSAVIVGTLLVLPIYLDLFYTASETSRVKQDIPFFTESLPNISSLNDVWQLFTTTTFPQIFGNPSSSSYPLLFDGDSVTPLIIFFILVGLFLRFRQTYGWWIFVLVCLCFHFIRPLYIFGVEHLGFNFSRVTPLDTSMLPLTIIAAHGADAVVRRPLVSSVSWAVILATLGTCTALVIAILFGLAQGLVICWGAVAISLLVVGLLGAQLNRAQLALLIAAVLVDGAFVSSPLMLRQDPLSVATNSTLVERVRAHLPSDSRFAVTSPGIYVLRPNLNAALGLASIHSYNSLPSRRYHSLIEALGGQFKSFGRVNIKIAPDYGSDTFWMSNISLILSRQKNDHYNLEPLGRIDRLYLYQIKSRMGFCLQVFVPTELIGMEDIDIGDPRKLVARQAKKTSDEGDKITVKVQPSPASLLILSQKYHRDWHANALSQSGWANARTVVVNGVFQGVLLPEGTRKVRLQFRPYASFAWIGHLFWSLLLMALLSQLPQFRCFLVRTKSSDSLAT